MVTIHNPYCQQIYIVVDTILYLYTLPIDSLLYFYSSLCLSYSLSQVQGCNIKGDLVLKKKVYVPKNEELMAEIIQLHHNVTVVEYGGRWKMTELVTRNYQWPEVINNIEKYVDNCYMCQRMKNRIEAPVEKLIANKVLEKLQTYLIVDFITKLLLAAEKYVILVVCDMLSKMAHFVVTIEEMSTERLVRLFRDNIQKLHGLPES